MLTHPSTVQTLRRHHLFSQLPEKVFKEVCNLATLRHLDCHGTLVHQGDPARRPGAVNWGKGRRHARQSPGLHLRPPRGRVGGHQDLQTRSRGQKRLDHPTR